MHELHSERERGEGGRKGGGVLITLTTKEEIQSGSSRAVEERTSFNKKQNRVILGKALCENTT